MASLLLRQDFEPAQPPAPALQDEWRGVLNALRVISLGCRVAVQTDLFKACALLSNKEDTARDAHARALLKCLRQAIQKNPVFYRPGTDQLSFDEAWLMQLLIATKAGDGDSIAFLIRSRVPAMYQRHIAFLIKGISEQFSQI